MTAALVSPAVTAVSGLIVALLFFSELQYYLTKEVSGGGGGLAPPRGVSCPPCPGGEVARGGLSCLRIPAAFRAARAVAAPAAEPLGAPSAPGRWPWLEEPAALRRELLGAEVGLWPPERGGQRTAPSLLPAGTPELSPFWRVSPRAGAEMPRALWGAAARGSRRYPVFRTSCRAGVVAGEGPLGLLPGEMGLSVFLLFPGSSRTVR